MHMPYTGILAAMHALEAAPQESLENHGLTAQQHAAVTRVAATRPQRDLSGSICVEHGAVQRFGISCVHLLVSQDALLAGVVHSQAWCEDLGALEVCELRDFALRLHHLAGNHHCLAEDGGAKGICTGQQHGAEIGPTSTRQQGVHNQRVCFNT